MNDLPTRATVARETADKVLKVYAKRAELAQQRYAKRVEQAVAALTAGSDCALSGSPFEWQRYALDLAERSILIWDTLRRRGNQFLEHERAGKPPVLHFEYQTILDGRTLARPVNYALLRIVEPEGVTAFEKSFEQLLATLATRHREFAA